MKVALLSHEGGGISSVSQGLALALSKRKVETTIFSTTTEHKIELKEINEYFKIVNLPVLDFPPRLVWFHLRNFKVLRKLLEDFTVVHAVSPEMGIPFTYFRSLLKKPLVTTLHSSHRGSFKAFLQVSIKNWVSKDLAYHVFELPLHDLIIRRSVKFSDKVIAVSSTTVNELKDWEKVDVSKISVINNGINFNNIHSENSDEAKRDTNEFSIIYAGRLFQLKGIRFLLKAYEQLHKKYGNVHLKIFGKGPLENEVKDFISKRNLRKNVHFGGFVPHNELLKEIRKSNLVVFPSFYENQPMFMLESMACKKPLISFNLPYAREIIKHRHNGLLTKPGDVTDMINKIVLVLEDRNLGRKLGEKAYEHIKENHNWDKQAEKYLQVYNNLL